jgi:hypothetical protein
MMTKTWQPNENNICPYMTIWLFPLYKQTTVIWNFHKMPFVCLLPNKQVQFITKMRVVPTGGEHKGGMAKDEQMTLSARKDFTSLKTQNWTQRIILKHLKPEDVGMLTLSSFLNATAGGCGHIPDLLLLFVIVVLVLVFIVLIVKALICAKLYLFVRQQTNKWHFVKIPNNSCLFVLKETTSLSCMDKCCAHCDGLPRFCHHGYNHDMKCLKCNTTWWCVRAYSLPRVQSIRQLPRPHGDHDDRHDEAHDVHRNCHEGSRSVIL